MISMADVPKSERFKGFFAIILVALFSVLIGVFTRYLNSYYTLFQQIYLRIFIAFILGFFIFGKSLHFEKLRKLSHKEWLLLLTRAAAGFAVGAPLWVAGFASAKLSNASFIDSIPMTAVMGFILLREKITVRKIFFLIMAFTGVVIISVPDLMQIAEWGKGELLIFISAIFFSFRSITRKFHSTLLNDQEIAQMLHFLGFSIVFLLSLVFREGLPLSEWRWQILAATILAALLNVGIMYFMNYGYARIEASLAANTSQLESAFGIALGFILYQEIPTVKTLIGGILIVASVILMNRNLVRR